MAGRDRRRRRRGQGARICSWSGRYLRELALPQGNLLRYQECPRLCEPEPFCRSARLRSWSRSAACRGARSSRWRVPPSSARRLQPVCYSRQTASTRSTRRSPSASAVQPIVRELFFRSFDLLDHVSLGHRLSRLSGDGTKGNAAPTASAATVFISIDVFIVSFFPAPRLLGTVLVRTFSFVCAIFRVRP